MRRETVDSCRFTSSAIAFRISGCMAVAPCCKNSC
ncbi:hypothetical protein MGSAQ_000648 [marine sediment metagenome]|uniref:Uncharacterized protein n=1 Tax=marine sediment metagenome TaxID=412755 RepID=A0A1B6NWM0_9ZZZZ